MLHTVDWSSRTPPVRPLGQARRRLASHASSAQSSNVRLWPVAHGALFCCLRRRLRRRSKVPAPFCRSCRPAKRFAVAFSVPTWAGSSPVPSRGGGTPRPLALRARPPVMRRPCCLGFCGRRRGRPLWRPPFFALSPLSRLGARRPPPPVRPGGRAPAPGPPGRAVRFDAPGGGAPTRGRGRLRPPVVPSRLVALFAACLSCAPGPGFPVRSVSCFASPFSGADASGHTGRGINGIQLPPITGSSSLTAAAVPWYSYSSSIVIANGPPSFRAQAPAPFRGLLLPLILIQRRRLRRLKNRHPTAIPAAGCLCVYERNKTSVILLRSDRSN